MVQCDNAELGLFHGRPGKNVWVKTLNILPSTFRVLNLGDDPRQLRLQAQALGRPHAAESDRASIDVPCGSFSLGGLTAQLLPAALSQLPDPGVQRDVNANGVAVSNLQVEPYFANAANAKVRELTKSLPAGYSSVHMKSMIKQYRFFSPDFPGPQVAYGLLNNKTGDAWRTQPASPDLRWLMRVDEIIPAAAQYVVKRACGFLPHLTADYRRKLVQIYHPSTQAEDHYTRKTYMVQPSRDTEVRVIGELKRFARYIHRTQGKDSPFYLAHQQYCKVWLVTGAFGQLSVAHVLAL